MAIPHAAPGEVIEILPAGPSEPEQSQTLIRAEHIEVFRYVLPAGKAVDAHTAAGLMVLQCVEGTVQFNALGQTRELRPGTLLYLPDHEPHALTALTNAVLLVTILLHRT